MGEITLFKMLVIFQVNFIAHTNWFPFVIIVRNILMNCDLKRKVTHFSCGGLIVGVSLKNSLCDRRGATQFMKGVVEISRGKAKHYVELVWQREVLKPHEPPVICFKHDQLLESGLFMNHISPMELHVVKSDDLVLASFLFSSDALQKIKQPITEELKEHCTMFELLSALA